MSQISREWEIIFDAIRDAWEGQILLCDWVLQRGIGEPLKSEKIPFKFLETFEVSYLWLIYNFSQ